jgi:toxin YoeB
MRTLAFTPTASAQYDKWAANDRKVRDRIVELLKATMQEPFKGIGKPEPLKHSLKGCWSRRINKEHRLVYQVTNDTIIVISCMFHY